MTNTASKFSMSLLLCSKPDKSSPQPRADEHSRGPWADKAVRRPEQFESPLISGIELGSGEYFARIGVGRPLKEFYMVIDTGSDVSWLQCQPCYDCYQQADPIFDASKSSTYKPLTCKTEQCASLDISACSRTGNCIYQVSYGDGSYTVGNFATETISFGASGPGGGNLSLPSQMRASSFSYCLVNRDSSSSSTLDFNTARPADSVLAPLLKNPLIKTFRYVDLTGISVGGRALPIPSSMLAIGSDGKGGVIVDSGTSVSRLQTEVYSLMRDAFRSMTQNLPTAGRLSLFDTCYNLSGMSSVKVPTVSFQFSGGKTLSLPPTNYLIPVDDEGSSALHSRGRLGHCLYWVMCSSRGHVSVSTWRIIISASVRINASISLVS
ncbi:UNVERIFIED_CONTAM: protein ASPARTIC PROTEASE IN GUARD CELL 1 [Sesamum latifolium]|uniref:Protein ASPARTIC PROTEASE IN GUARD CELL 1 n=1 Tax=Sesamum latifolium TaxID=2727402 RepID=A0AAW2UFY6_9LAMI